MSDNKHFNAENYHIRHQSAMNFAKYVSTVAVKLRGFRISAVFLKFSLKFENFLRKIFRTFD